MELFVYGTLRPSFGHPLGLALARDGTFQGMARVPGRLYDYGEYPVAIPDFTGCEELVGEVFAIAPDHDLVRELDVYEDYHPSDPEQSLFVRAKVMANFPNGGCREVEIYWYRASVEGLPRIEAGDYEVYCQSKQR
jgi:gamma-glutamylcyclotransferase (GGCT)/AIG2-like uncharacterized protein YtfP